MNDEAVKVMILKGTIMKHSYNLSMVSVGDLISSPGFAVQIGTIG